jgi:glycosyltransferase involved in cell wall biosynthesis
MAPMLVKLKGGEEMYNFHKNNDISINDICMGRVFPIVIMEAMAFGAIPLVSNIDAIPEHIIDRRNGFLLKNVINENDLVKETVDSILAIIKNKEVLNNISYQAYDYAISNFSAEKFKVDYREVILNKK